MSLFDTSEPGPDDGDRPRHARADDDSLECHRRHLRRGSVAALGGQLERGSAGWVVRVPLRAEHVTVERQTYVVEEVAVRTAPVEDTTRVEEAVRREELRVQRHEFDEGSQRVRWGE